MMKFKRSNTKKNDNPMPKLVRIAVLIGSFLGAFLLWIYAIGYDSSLFEETYNGIQVVVEGEELLREEKGYTLASGQDFSSITVIAKGKRSTLNSLSTKDFKAVVDVTASKKAGWQTLDIKVVSPNGVEVVSQSSTTVEIFIDEFTQKSNLLTVEVDTGDGSYRYGEGVSRVDFTVNPVVVTVSGPKSVLDNIEKASVKFPLDGNEIKEDLRGHGAILLLDKNGKVVENQYVVLSETTAEVSLNVVKEKTLPVRVAFNGGAIIEGITVETPSPGAITVYGSSAAIAALGSELVLTVDETTLQPGKTHELQFPIVEMLPKGISCDNSGNITVKVTMPKLSVVGYTVKANKITIENLPENYVGKVLNDIKVKIAGPVDAFSNFDPETISVKVDFNNVTVETPQTASITPYATDGAQNTDVVYKADAIIELTGDNPALYILNEKYEISFTVSVEVVPDLNKKG